MYIQRLAPRDENRLPHVSALENINLPACKWDGERREYVLAVISGGGVLIKLSGKNETPAKFNCLARVCPVLFYTCDINEILRIMSRELIYFWEKTKESTWASRERLKTFSEKRGENNRDVIQLCCRMVKRHQEAYANICILEEFPEGLKN